MCSLGFTSTLLYDPHLFCCDYVSRPFRLRRGYFWVIKKTGFFEEKSWEDEREEGSFVVRERIAEATVNQTKRCEYDRSGLASLTFSFGWVDIVRKTNREFSIWFCLLFGYSRQTKMRSRAAAASVIQIPVVLAEATVLVCPSDLWGKRREERSFVLAFGFIWQRAFYFFLKNIQRSVQTLVMLYVMIFIATSSTRHVIAITQMVKISNKRR